MDKDTHCSQQCSWVDEPNSLIFSMGRDVQCYPLSTAWAHSKPYSYQRNLSLLRIFLVLQLALNLLNQHHWRPSYFPHRDPVIFQLGDPHGFCHSHSALLSTVAWAWSSTIQISELGCTPVKTCLGMLRFYFGGGVCVCGDNLVSLLFLRQLKCFLCKNGVLSFIHRINLDMGVQIYNLSNWKIEAHRSLELTSQLVGFQINERACLKSDLCVSWGTTSK